ncbi:MAG: hypothetical protein IJX75_05495 [Clostridia bacterium]|nr:hypothetical protein [Clostridia bacterium]
MANIKKSLISCFSGLAALCLSVGLGLNTATAGAEEMFALPETVTGTATEAVEGVVEISSFTISEKASVRVKSPNGIRFETGISSADLAKLPSNATFGTLIIPTRVLNGAELNLDAVTTLDAVNVVANVWREHSTATTLVYSGVLGGESENGSFQDYPEAFYNEEISARGYVSYTDANGETQVIYTTDTAKRSLAYVAGAALQGAYGKAEGEDEYLSDTSKTFLKKVVDTVVTSVSFTQNDEAVTELAMETRETVDLVLVGAQGIPAIITTTGGITVDENLTVKAVSAGEATLTATVGNRTATVTFNVTQCVKDKIAETLTGNQIAMFNSEDYKELITDTTIQQYNHPQTDTRYQLTQMSNQPMYSFVPNTTGTGYRIEFPKTQTYTSGYLRMRIAFNDLKWAVECEIHVYKLDETNSANSYVLDQFGGKQHGYVYIPMSEIVDENNELKGIQIAFVGAGGWIHFGDMTYATKAYEVEENISSLEIMNGNEYDVSYGVTENGVAMDGAEVSLLIADTSVLTIVDGRLTALKAGTTTVTLQYWNKTSVSTWITAAAESFNVTVQKSYMEQLADTITGNEIHMWDTTLYTYTMGDLIIDDYNNPCAAVANYPEGWYYWYTTMGADYNAIRVNAAAGGSGMRLTFAKTLTFAQDGYLKIRLAAKTQHTLHLYNYDETDADNGIVIKGSEVGMGSSDTWVTVYVPIKDFLNTNGQIEGIQFAIEGVNGGPSGWYGFGTIRYVAASDLPTNAVVVQKTNA